MDVPLPSQASQANAPQIFLNDDGSPIQIFTEAGGIQGRPKFMRKLRSHGASICSDPKEAQIILVNQDTPQGRQFIRDWGTDDSKVVLHYLWVNRSIEEGKPLFAEDDWGKCETRDDGLPIGEVDEDGDIRKSPLPTPRVTPVERKGSLSRMQEYEHYTSVSQPQQRARNTMPPPAASTSSAESRSMTPMAVSQSSTHSIPIPAMNMADPMAQAQAQYPMQMAAMMQMNPMMNPMFNPMMFQQMFTNMMMNSTGGQYNEEAFKMALADIVTKLPANSQTQPPMYNRPGTHSPVPEQALPFPDVPRKSSHSGRRSMSESSDSPPLYLVDRKGKQREPSPSSKRRKVSASPYTNNDTMPRKPSGSDSGPPKKKIFIKSGRPLSFFVQIDLHNRFHVVDAIKKNGGKIEKDHELADYVILYTANKSQKTFTDLLRAAQLAGKIAVPSRYVHECVERGALLSPSQYEFDYIVAGKRKRRSSIVDMDDSDVDEKAIKAEEKRLKKNERQAQRRRERKLEEEAQSLKPKLSEKAAKQAMLAEGLKQAEERVAVTGRRTPPIPPEHTRRQWSSGFSFTHEERKFASDYAQLLVERDHTISASALALAVFKKLPHHTLKSWKTQLAKDAGKDIDTWRKRSSIAFRKAQRLSQSGPSSAPSDVSMQEPAASQISHSPAVAQETISSQFTQSNGGLNSDIRNGLSEEEFKLLEEDDLNVISQFFVQTDETEQEDDVWARLGSTYHCHTERNWQDFYQKHYDEVQRRYAEIMENNP